MQRIASVPENPRPLYPTSGGDSDTINTSMRHPSHDEPPERNHPKPKTRSIQAIINGEGESDSESMQNLMKRLQKQGLTPPPSSRRRRRRRRREGGEPRSLRKTTPQGRVTGTATKASSFSTERHKEFLATDRGVAGTPSTRGEEEEEDEDDPDLVQATLDTSAEIMEEHGVCSSVFDYLESLEAYAGPECLHEALDRFYLREKQRARRHRSWPRHRKRSHK